MFTTLKIVKENQVISLKNVHGWMNLKRPVLLIRSESLMRVKITLLGGVTELAHVKGMPVGDWIISMLMKRLRIM